MRRGLIVLLFVAGAAIFARVWRGSDAERRMQEAAKRNGTEESARRVCRELVRQKLIAPAAAVFVDGARVASDGQGRWQVAGAVDAPNAVGVPLRATYACDVRAKGDGTYDLAALTVDTPR